MEKSSKQATGKELTQENFPNLSENLITDLKETFNTFDTEKEGVVEGYDMVITMFLAMGCDVNRAQVDELYQKVFEKRVEKEEEIELNLEQFAMMVDSFINEQDPVDGVIDTIQDTYDPKETGQCSFDDIIKFMEEYNYLNADKEACLKILETFKGADNMIDYKKAMKSLIQ